MVLVQLFLDYTAETYSKFMQGDDTFEEEDDSFLTKLSKHSISLGMYSLNNNLLFSVYMYYYYILLYVFICVNTNVP